jgi:hypothetical protein
MYVHRAQYSALEPDGHLASQCLSRFASDGSVVAEVTCLSKSNLTQATLERALDPTG